MNGGGTTYTTTTATCSLIDGDALIENLFYYPGEGDILSYTIVDYAIPS